MSMGLTIFWFRRDLRLQDNIGLTEALKKNKNVQPIFIFDNNILSELEKDDARVTFIHECLTSINNELRKSNSSLLTLHGDPIEVWKKLINDNQISSVYTNNDYEPYATKRDQQINELLSQHNIKFISLKDQVVFEKDEITKNDGKPYTVYTPYKNKWLQHFRGFEEPEALNLKNLNISNYKQLTLKDIGFSESLIKVKPFTLADVDEYAENRDFPAKDKTSYLSPHLRFGTINPRQIIRKLRPENNVFLSEIIWREFFMQILYHFPNVVNQNFKAKYDGIQWRNNKEEFEKWCNGETGYPIVDAGMRQLNKTGYMHNRVRMVVAGFLCKHLLIDWRWGEAYFAKKLLDYDLSANNGNWQWAAGTGCDAAPYFRIFNPIEQLKKFDKKLEYTNTWIENFNSLTYPQPIVDHKLARERALKVYKEGLN